MSAWLRGQEVSLRLALSPKGCPSDCQASRPSACVESHTVRHDSGHLAMLVDLINIQKRLFQIEMIIDPEMRQWKALPISELPAEGLRKPLARLVDSFSIL